MQPAEDLAAVGRLVTVVRTGPDPGRASGEPAVELRAAEAEAREAEERLQRAVAAEHDRDPERHAAGGGQLGREERALPRAADRRREVVAELAGRLRLRPVGRVPVDGGGGGVDPHRHGPRAVGDGARELGRRLHARAQDLPAVRRAVAAVHALAREVHEEVGAVEEPADPLGVAPARVGAGAADRADQVALVAELAHEHLPDEAGRSRDDRGARGGRPRRVAHAPKRARRSTVVPWPSAQV